MLRTIVEGEPGIFPEPVARAMRKIGGLFDRGRSTAPEPPDEPRNDQPRTGDPTDEGRTGERTSDGAVGPADGPHEPGER